MSANIERKLSPSTDKIDTFKSGYVAIIGKPNAGKSTLLNALVGEKIAITSDKPQTTRDRIAGIFTTTEFQIVFLDTPGIIDPRDRFNETLMARVHEALQHVDVVYHLVDSTDRAGDEIGLVSAALSTASKAAKFMVVNKMDKFKVPSKRQPIPPGLDTTAYDELFYISALKGKNLHTLLEKTVARLSPGPMYYDSQQLSDRDERFLAAEIVREKVFRRTGAEIPYSVYTEVEEFKERENKDYIRVMIYVERESQKGILIGEGGRTLKDIGQDARREIEKLTGRPAFLELWVKVRKDWRKSEFDLANFGFKKPKRKK